MGNLILNAKAPGQPYLQLSNGAMSVLITTLVLSGSDLAATSWQQACITWLAEHDQAVFGLGVVGFDVDEIAWTEAEFAQQHTFVLRVIERAIHKHRWSVLDYDPPFVQADLQDLRQIIQQYQRSFIDCEKDWSWYAAPDRFIKCPRHQVYMHAHGCVICNDT